MNNPLDAWTAQRIGLGAAPLTRAALDAYQLLKLHETVAWAQQRSPFYRRLLAGVDADALRTLADLQRLPFTTADDLRRNDPPLLCVSQSQVSHVVTLETSATSGPPKRLFFSAEEMEATLDFFAQGMRLPAHAGDRVLILFPATRAGSVGELLARALTRIGATPVVHGWPADIAAAAADVLRCERPDVVAGTPVALLALARHEAQTRATASAPLRVRSVLASADHAAASLRGALTALWGCAVFEHYGMTEMGLGGGVDCAAHAGYHLREGELLVEIVDPHSGAPVADGEAGEVVITTLTRRALPLLRYRTGDLSRRLTGACACASPLARLERITRRIDAAVALPGAGQAMELTIADLDEALFALDQVADFSATLYPAHGDQPSTLAIELSAANATADAATLCAQGAAAIAALPAVANACRSDALRVVVSLAAGVGLLPRSGKRALKVAAAP